MGRKMKIILIRHGESEFNKISKEADNRIYSGQFDCKLSKNGKKAAKDLRNSIYIKQIEKIYSSDLKRALQTAKLSTKRLDIIIDKRLRERSLGDFNGKYVKQLKEKYPDYFDNGKLKNFSNDFIVKAPNGENNTEVMERARDFINTIDLNENTTIGIFSHGRFLGCFIALLMNLEKEETLKLKIPNTVPIVLSGNRIGNFIMEFPTLKDLIK